MPTVDLDKLADVERLLEKVEMLQKYQPQLEKVRDLQDKLQTAVKELPPELIGFAANPPEVKVPRTRTRMTKVQKAAIDQKVASALKGTKPMTSGDLQQATGYDAPTISRSLFRLKSVLTQVKADKNKKDGPFNVAYVLKK